MITFLFLFQQYKIEDGQVMTLLLEAAIHEEIEFMRELLDTYHVNVNGTGTVTKFIKPIEGVTALWMAAGQYLQSFLLLPLT